MYISLQVLTALDPELAKVSRDECRRQGLQVIVRRISEQTGRPAADSVDETVDVLQVLTSFQAFDQLAGAKRGVEEVTPIVQRLARQLLAPAP